MSNYATMGYIGFVKLGTSVIRATSCDIKTTQEISYPEVIDGRADTTVYQLGPKITGGTVAFPLVHDTRAGSCVSETATPDLTDSLVGHLWAMAAKRDNTGRLQTFNTFVRYTDSLSYQYPSCYVNNLTFTITQSDAIQVSTEVWGGATGGTDDRQPGSSDPNNSLNQINYLSPARIATWQDAVVALYGIGTSVVLGRELREFSVTINNNLERFWTLNGLLSTFDIAPKKREISGTVKLIGHNTDLSAYTITNDSRYTSEAQIAFGFKIGSTAAAPPYWATGLNGCVFEIEEVQLATGLFETTTKYRATGSCNAPGAIYDATYLGRPGAISKGAFGDPSLGRPPLYRG